MSMIRSQIVGHNLGQSLGKKLGLFSLAAAGALALVSAMAGAGTVSASKCCECCGPDCTCGPNCCCASCECCQSGQCPANCTCDCGCPCCAKD
jgi:hypothetical protein